MLVLAGSMSEALWTLSLLFWKNIEKNTFISERALVICKTRTQYLICSQFTLHTRVLLCKRSFHLPVHHLPVSMSFCTKNREIKKYFLVDFLLFFILLRDFSYNFHFYNMKVLRKKVLSFCWILYTLITLLSCWIRIRYVRFHKIFFLSLIIMRTLV